MKKSFLISAFCFIFLFLMVMVIAGPVSAKWLGSWSEGYRNVICGSRVQIGTGPTVMLTINQYNSKWCVAKAYHIAKAFEAKYRDRGEVFVLLNLVDVNSYRHSHAQAVFQEGGVYWPLGHLSPPQDGVFETRGTLCGITNFEFGDYNEDERVFIQITEQTEGEFLKELRALNMSLEGYLIR